MRISVLLLLLNPAFAFAGITGDFDFTQKCEDIHLTLGGNNEIYDRNKHSRYHKTELKYQGQYFDQPAEYMLFCNRNNVFAIRIKVTLTPLSEYEEYSKHLSAEFTRITATTGEDFTNLAETHGNKPIQQTLWKNNELLIILMQFEDSTTGNIRVIIEKNE